MSEFLFVIPEGWIRIPDEVIGTVGASSMESLVTSGVFLSLTDVLREYGAIGPDDNVKDAKMFNAEVLVIQLG